MYEDVVVEHITAQQGAITPAQNKASTCRPECHSASTLTELTRASMSSSFLQLAAFSKRTQISKSAKNYNHPHKQLKLVSHVTCDRLAVISNPVKIYYGVYSTALSQSFLCISYMHTASGLFSWSM